MNTHMEAWAEMLADLLSAQEGLPDLGPWLSEGPFGGGTLIGGQHHDAGLLGVFDF
ncbi:hypothetical protein VST63_01360 [Mycolicibacterium sp. 050232]|uniref:hypothetical protein n=1 Tax=Mycolicibacterium sp. 050232 TaxID=3113982 RepID=UPI002E291EC3|nr:hypothetical protein [Mycolicibacterium sp. 050232]MED5810994.1 hypothetical protein [Mycolicibacterium sp. 050232]